MDDLNRQLAPFGVEIWQRIDEAAVNAARDVLTGRRFLEVDGPYG
ncbi:MAG TPA: encapsulin, partial [Gammaproteobacteria bacterium]|nr:encapsulin [Gammaproteobacteria bacterium]